MYILGYVKRISRPFFNILELAYKLILLILSSPLLSEINYIHFPSFVASVLTSMIKYYLLYEFALRSVIFKGWF
jgi:hypothetical protein